MDNYDFSGPKTAEIDRSITLQEHKIEHGPISYMAYSNLKNAKHEIEEILCLLNECDDLPQWADQMLAEAADRLQSVKGYILSQKDVVPVAHYHHEAPIDPVPYPQDEPTPLAPTVYVEDYGAY